MSGPVPAVLDTNALLLPFTDGTDIAQESERLLGAVRLVVPTPVVVELRTLADGDDATARAARGALRLLDRYEQEPSLRPGDDAVLDVATRLGGAVLSNDRRLQTEARRRGLVVLASRGRGRLHRLDSSVA